jgi:cell division protein FtsB
MKQMQLLESYIKALEHENDAKNKEREILYEKIDNLNRENAELNEEMRVLKNKKSGEMEIK